MRIATTVSLGALGLAAAPASVVAIASALSGDIERLGPYDAFDVHHSAGLALGPYPHDFDLDLGAKNHDRTLQVGFSFRCDERRHPGLCLVEDGHVVALWLHDGNHVPVQRVVLSADQCRPIYPCGSPPVPSYRGCPQIVVNTSFDVADLTEITLTDEQAFTNPLIPGRELARAPVTHSQSAVPPLMMARL